MKKCSGCKIEKDLNNFTKNSSRKDGLNHNCKECFKKYYEVNKNKIIESATKSYNQNKEYRKIYLKEYGKNWRKNNKDKNCYKSNMYRASKLQRIVSWANLEEIKRIYENCPKGYHVDHIIPLKGKNISGLHIENNLQYLLATENCRKGNR